MPATRDQSQKVTFVYSNLYQIYKQGRDQKSSEEPIAINKRQAVNSPVIKADDLHAKTSQVSEFAPTQFIGKRIEKPEVLVRSENQNAVDSLKKNLEQLNDLHSRLRFMLKELEDLTKE